MGFVWASVSLGIVIGPVTGGILIAFVDWRAIFFVKAPVGLAGIWLAARFVRDVPPVPGQRMDYLGAGLLGVGLLGLSLGLTLGQTPGFGAPSSVALFAAAVEAALASSPCNSGAAAPHRLAHLPGAAPMGQRDRRVRG